MRLASSQSPSGGDGFVNVSTVDKILLKAMVVYLGQSDARHGSSAGLPSFGTSASLGVPTPFAIVGTLGLPELVRAPVCCGGSCGRALAARSSSSNRVAAVGGELAQEPAGVAVGDAELACEDGASEALMRPAMPGGDVTGQVQQWSRSRRRQ